MVSLMEKKNSTSNLGNQHCLSKSGDESNSQAIPESEKETRTASGDTQSYPPPKLFVPITNQIHCIDFNNNLFAFPHCPQVVLGCIRSKIAI